MLLEYYGKKERKKKGFPFWGGGQGSWARNRTSATVLPLGEGDNGECCFCGNLQASWQPVQPLGKSMWKWSLCPPLLWEGAILMGNVWRQSSSQAQLGTRRISTHWGCRKKMGPAPRKRLGTDAAEQALFLHTRDCLCTLPARSCEWKINNSMSCRRRNNATLHQTGPRFPVSLESVLHKALPFGLYILLMCMHIYGTKG